MRRVALLAPVFVVMSIAAPASADVLPPGHKSVALSIAVEADVPEGKALVLARTFRGAMVITPGTPQDVQWHPMGGDMQLRLIDRGDTAKIEALRESMNREEINAIVDKGVACHEPFQGVRTIPESSPESGVRWVYSVALAGGACTATLERTEKLDADGVALPAAPATPAAPEPKPAPAKAVEAGADEGKTDAVPEKPNTSERAGMCSVERRSDRTVSLALLALALFGGRWRRRRARAAQNR